MTGRRKIASAGAVAAGLSSVAHAAGTDTIKIGLIGTGGRGTHDVVNCAKSAPGVQIWALGDLFQNRVETCYNRITKAKDLTADQVKVTPERCFSGWDNPTKVIDCVDLVLMCQPPGFRPLTMRAAVEAGKHVFAEKPVAVDPVGVRSVIETAKMADEKKLAIVAGTQTRHNARAIAAMKRVHDGRIGDLRNGACYFLTGELWHRGSDPKWSEMEYQCRNWYYFCWLSGDVIVEQSIHTIDVTNWVMGAYPISALGQGGRTIPIDPKLGNIWDHMTVDYEYPNGAHVIHMDRQWPDCDGSGWAGLVGTKGRYSRNEITGQNPWKFEGKLESSGVYEQRDMIESIRKGEPKSEGENGAYAALTAIMGRESAYTGKLVKWDEILNSELDLFPKKMEFGQAPKRPVPIPGRPRPA